MTRRSPKILIDKKKLLESIDDFLDKYSLEIKEQASRLEQYFEMYCYNLVVDTYFKFGYKISVGRLVDGFFKYKISPSGYPENFSFFIVEKILNYKNKSKTFKYEIHHNLTAESALSKRIFYTPDISVISYGAIQELDNGYYYGGQRKFFYVSNCHLQTFFEVKNLIPFPELLFSFTGLISEFANESFVKKTNNKNPKHIAPSLILSGSGGNHVNLIRKELINRYNINIFFGMGYRIRGSKYLPTAYGNCKKIGCK